MTREKRERENDERDDERDTMTREKRERDNDEREKQ